MTAPAGQPTPVQHNHMPVYANASVLRAVVSVCETVGFVVAAILAGMNNGSDFHHAVFAAMLAFIAHGVNHNAGGSPV